MPRASEESRRKVEAWIQGLVGEKLAQQRRRAAEKLRPLMEKRRRGERLTHEDVEAGMGILCFKHLAFCCSAEKKCGYRDSLLRALGLTKRDYADYKEACGVIFWIMLAEKKVT